MTDAQTPLFDDVWDYKDPAGTAERLLALLPAATDGDPGYLAELRTQMARTFSLRGQFDQAIVWLSLVEPVIGPALPIATIRYLLEKGRTLNSAGEPAAALPLFLDAFARAQKAGAEFHAVDAAHMAAIAAPDPADQLAWNERAITVAEQSGSERVRRWLGSLYNNVGWVYQRQRRFDEALRIFEKALTCREAETDDGAADRARIARWCIARTKRSLGRLDEALAEQEALAAYYEAAGAADGYVHEELGEILLALDRPDEARPHFRRAHEILAKDPWLAENERKRLARLLVLGVKPEAFH